MPLNPLQVQYPVLYIYIYNYVILPIYYPHTVYHISYPKDVEILDLPSFLTLQVPSARLKQRWLDLAPPAPLKARSAEKNCDQNLWKSQVKGTSRLMDDFMRFSCNFSDIFWCCSLIFILFLTRPRTWRRNMLKWGDKPTRSNKLQSVVYELRHEMARKRNLQLS